MAAAIPASLLNMRIHSVTDLGLGALCFIFQVKMFLFFLNILTMQYKAMLIS